MRKEDVDTMLRWLALIAALGCWWFSIDFNKDGFRFTGKDSAVAGYFLAFVVTVLQLVAIRKGARNSPTMVFLGILAYIYGIGTNLIGILYNQGITDIYAVPPERYLFPGIIAGVLEIAPERLLMWGILGSLDNDDDDLFSAVLFRKPGRRSAPNKPSAPAGHAQKGKSVPSMPAGYGPGVSFSPMPPKNPQQPQGHVGVPPGFTPINRQQQ